jgi:hypothetical protein
MLDKVIEWLAIKGDNDEELSNERVIALALIIANSCPEFKGTIDDKIKLLSQLVGYINSNKVTYETAMRED